VGEGEGVYGIKLVKRSIFEFSAFKLGIFIRPNLLKPSQRLLPLLDIPARNLWNPLGLNTQPHKLGHGLPRRIIHKPLLLEHLPIESEKVAVDMGSEDFVVGPFNVHVRFERSAEFLPENLDVKVRVGLPFCGGEGSELEVGTFVGEELDSVGFKKDCEGGATAFFCRGEGGKFRENSASWFAGPAVPGSSWFGLWGGGGVVVFGGLFFDGGRVGGCGGFGGRLRFLTGGDGLSGR
jgi:hypothetical protein